MRTLPETFTLLLSVLRNIIAPVAAKDRARTDFLVYVYGRITRIGRRFQRLYARWKNGALPKPETRTPRTAPLSPAPRPTLLRSGMPIVPLPTGRMWLIREIQQTAATRSQLQHWLANTPELAEFLAAAPQARRILNPLCHMLGLKLGTFIPGPPPKPRPRPQAAPEPPPKPPPSPDHRLLRAQHMFGYLNKSPRPSPAAPDKRFSSA